MFIMVVTDNCPRCKGSEAALEKAGLLDKVDLVNISTDRGRELATDYKLTMAGSDILDISNATKMSVSDFIESQAASNA